VGAGVRSRPARGIERVLALPVQHWKTLCLALLVVGAAWPQGPNSVSGILSPDSVYFGPWSTRIGIFNLFELAFAALALVWLVRRIWLPGRESSFDRPLLVAAGALAVFQPLALAISGDDVQFLLFDLERVLVPIAAYAIVTRCIDDLPRLRAFVIVVCVAIAARAAELVLAGRFGAGTAFGTATGRDAILITEDSLLLALPLLVAWGAFVDGRLKLPAKVATVLFGAAVLAVDLLSLRRGPLLFISTGLVLRSLAGPRWVLRRVIPAFAVIVVVFALVGPHGGVARDLRYVVTSAALQSKDSSSGQRSAELKNFSRNLGGVDWVIGRGLGTIWRADVQARFDIASYGSRETAYVRLGWHVYGLDWAYKFGLLGILILAATAVFLARRTLHAMRRAGGWMRSYALSLTLCLLAFLPFVFTGIRIGAVAGLVLGVLSRLVDLSPGRGERPTPPAPPA
jgi:hypothetical protein